MSIGETRSQLVRVKETLASGHSDARRGREEAAEAGSSYEELERQTLQTHDQGSSAHALLMQAREALEAFSRQVLHVAQCNEVLGEDAIAAGAHFTLASGKARRTFEPLRQVVGEGDDATLQAGLSIRLSDYAARAATRTMLAANMDKSIQERYAEQLNALAQQIGAIGVTTKEIIETFAQGSPASQMLDEQPSATGAEPQFTWLGEPAPSHVLDRPAAILESGAKACQAFEGAIQGIDQHLEHL